MDIYNFYNSINEIVSIIYSKKKMYGGKAGGKGKGDAKGAPPGGPAAGKDAPAGAPGAPPADPGAAAAQNPAAAEALADGEQPPPEGEGGDKEEEEKSDKEKFSKDYYIKLTIKILIALFFVFLLPLAPFVALMYYTFKKMKIKYDVEIKSL